MSDMTTDLTPVPGSLLAQLPGTPRPRSTAVAEFRVELAKARERIAPPLWPLFLLDEDDAYRWRTQLDCGCIHEVLTRGKDQFPDQRNHLDLLGRAWLPHGEMWCNSDHDTPKPYREIVEWISNKTREFPPDPEVDPDRLFDPETWAKIRRTEPRISAFWRVKLSCGHYVDQVCTDVDWRPEDGPRLVTVQRAAEMLAEFDETCTDDTANWRPSEHDHIRKMIELRWPRPAPDTDCFTCSRVHRIVGYQRVGWLAARKKAARPKLPRREVLADRLKKIEAEANRLRRELDELG